MRILVLDIETSGFNHTKDVIFEIGAVELNLETGEIIPKFDQMFREKHLCARHREAWIFSNSDMKIEDVRNSPAFEDVKDDIQKLFNQYLGRIVAFNRPFDADFLKSRGFNLGEDMGDPMRDSTKYFNIPHKNGRGIKWPSVQNAWDILFPDKPIKEAHRGFQDSSDEAKIMYELYKRKVIWQNLV